MNKLSVSANFWRGVRNAVLCMLAGCIFLALAYGTLWIVQQVTR